mmetsp:Transcript_913/g.1471  ORF Transcript_913/g.1471 Transcript_913/m.1471 type:complete len:124 (-) Transcript_913:1092-1463(-)
MTDTNQTCQLINLWSQSAYAGTYHQDLQARPQYAFSSLEAVQKPGVHALAGIHPLAQVHPRSGDGSQAVPRAESAPRTLVKPASGSHSPCGLLVLSCSIRSESSMSNSFQTSFAYLLTPLLNS